MTTHHEPTAHHQPSTDTVTRPLPGTRAGRLLTVLGACVAAMLIWLVQGPLTGVDLTVRTGATTTEVGPVAVIAASLMAGLAGWALLAILERAATQARRVWRIVAVAVFVVSLAGPLFSAVTPTAMGALMAMHAVVAAILVAGLSRRARA